ncbi:MAG: hypothetical protein IKZ04_06885, partial [Spirochaetaceae bacterium]|nr:hypothetical protein [Spirochaetaceae bacterium]
SESVPVPSKNYNLNKEVTDAMKVAHDVAYKYVEKELDIWTDEMMSRVDEDFLDDYFSFMEVKKRELLSVYNTVVNFINKNAETPEEAAIRELEEEIERKVIKPEISQARINNITSKAINLYAETLDEQLIRVQENYNIPVIEWNKYISDITGLTLDMENRNYPIAFKTAVVSGSVLTAYAASPVIKNVAVKVSTKIAEKSALKVGTKVAQKTTEKALLKGSKGLAKGIPYIGWAVTAGICIWDIIDYSKTSAEGKTLLKKNLAEYFREIKTELLCSTEHSIMGSITQWENSVKAKLTR